MIRWLLYRFVPFYLLLTLLAAGGALLFSETGLRILWAQAQPYLPQGLRIDQVQGRLLGRISVHGLHFQDQEREIRIGHAWLRWQPMALLRGEVVISDIVVAQARVHWPAAEQATTPAGDLPAIPRLPDVHLQRLRLRDLHYSDAVNPPLQLQSASLSARLQAQALRLDLSSLRTVGWGDWRLQVSGLLAPDALVLESLSLEELAEGPLAVRGNGHCAWPALDCAARLSWARLRWPLEEARWFSARGEAELSTRQGELRARLRAQAEGEQLPASELNLQLAPGGPGSHAIQADWRSASGALALEARYQPASRGVSGKLYLNDLDLSPWLAEYPSQLNGSTRFRWDDSQRLELEQLLLQGRLRGYAFKASADGHYQQGRWALRGLQLEQGESRLSADLSRDPHWRGSLRLQSPRLDALHPDLKGLLDLDLALSGKRALPAVSWSLKGSALGWQDIQLNEVAFAGRWRDGQMDWQLQGDDWTLPGVQIARLEQQSKGSPAQADHQLRLLSEHGELKLQGQSRWNGPQQQLALTLNGGELRLLDGEPWRLQAPARLGYRHAQRSLQLASQCWLGGAARSCLALDWDGSAVQGQWTLTDYELDRLGDRLPGIARITGRTGLRLDIPRSSPDQLQFDLRLDSGPLRVLRQLDDEMEELLLIQPGHLQARGRLPSAQASWNFPLDETQGISGHWMLDSKQIMQGELRIALQELELLTALVPEILQASGSINAQLQFAGPLRQPRVGGTLQLRDGEFHLDRPEIVLKNTRLDLAGNEDSTMVLSLSTESGDGQLDLNGDLDWRQSKTLFNARIKGDRFLAVATPEARVLASPDLELALRGHKVDVSGRLLIPSARIQPRSLNAPSQLRAPDPDQVILGEEGAQLAPRYQLSSRVELLLGDDVSFSGFGLNAALAGRLMTRVRPGKQATGTGELSLVKGRYKAYGQDLTIERGRLIFSGGALSEPGLDVRAYRQATPEIRAGVIVRGPIKRPELSLYSDPQMRETDQLSYLVLGRAAESRNEADQDALNNAALALGLKGSDFLANRFKGKLGLDEVRIGTSPGESSEQASLVLGKYLSPDIYVSYGLGLFEPISVFRLRYRLSSRWSLQTESGLESGGDLLYTIER